jgi:hypothetical protein
MSCAAFCRIESRMCYSRSWLKAACFPRCPSSSSPCHRGAWIGNRGQSNSLVSALILTDILGRASGMSLTYAVRWHHNSSRRKSGSPYGSSQTFPGEQNSSRRGKMISMGALAPRPVLATFSGLQWNRHFARGLCLVFLSCGLALS